MCGGFIGGKWTNMVYYFPVANETDSMIKFSDGELVAKFKKYANLTERVKSVGIYKRPLSFDGEPDTVFHHQFVVFETVSGWFWSIEKDTEAIVMQRSKIASDVVLRFRQKPRERKVRKVTGNFSNETLETIVDWIWIANLLNCEYHIISRNCKDFAERMYMRCAANSVSDKCRSKVFSAIASKYKSNFQKRDINPGDIFKTEVEFIKQKIVDDESISSFSICKDAVRHLIDLKRMQLPTSAGKLPADFDTRVTETENALHECQEYDPSKTRGILIISFYYRHLLFCDS